MKNKIHENRKFFFILPELEKIGWKMVRQLLLIVELLCAKNHLNLNENIVIPIRNWIYNINIKELIEVSNIILDSDLT